MKLHTADGIIDLDATYSKGKFYDNTGITPPTFKYDIQPQLDEVVYGDGCVKYMQQYSRSRCCYWCWLDWLNQEVEDS